MSSYRSPIEQVTDAHFHRQFDLNVLGLILAAKEALKHSALRPGGIYRTPWATIDTNPGAYAPSLPGFLHLSGA